MGVSLQDVEDIISGMRRLRDDEVRECWQIKHFLVGATENDIIRDIAILFYSMVCN